jgi:hypothetical protein
VSELNQSLPSLLVYRLSDTRSTGP